MELLTVAGRLLLEYNESTGEIHRALTATALALAGEDCDVAVSYSGIVVALVGEGPAVMPVRELRYNAALQVRIHAILAQVRSGVLEPAAALASLQRADVETPRHAPWAAVIMLGMGAAGLAGILGADTGAAAVAALSTGFGLFARQWLHQRRFSLLAQPLVAALIGSVLGGLAIRLGWTRTPGLALIVPCLMLVPGPHFINGLLDLIENFLPMSLARLGLATGILVASSLGLLVGVELTQPNLPAMKEDFKNSQLNLLTDMTLAGVVTCGFAVYYNAAWPQIYLAVVGGAAGHGLRFLALEAGASLPTASFIGGLTVGVVAAWIAQTRKLPVAVIAFAGTVTMMPGLHIYSALQSARQIMRRPAEVDLSTIAGTLSYGLQSAAVVGSLGLGVIIAIRTMQHVLGHRR